MGASQDMSGDSGKVYLRKKITLTRAIALTIGTIIGSGIFISPKGVLKNSGNVGLSLIIWLACGILSMCGEYCASNCCFNLNGSRGLSWVSSIYLRSQLHPLAATISKWSGYTGLLKFLHILVVWMKCPHTLVLKVKCSCTLMVCD